MVLMPILASSSNSRPVGCAPRYKCSLICSNFRIGGPPAANSEAGTTMSKVLAIRRIRSSQSFGCNSVKSVPCLSMKLPQCYSHVKTSCNIIIPMSLLRWSSFVVAVTPVLLAQQPSQATPPKEPTEQQKEEIDSGIPIASEVVRKSCSPCHKVDEKSRMSRISWRRTTPEGWEQTIKRMVSL